MFPIRFPSPKNADKASILLVLPGSREPEGVGRETQPSPPVLDKEMPEKAARLRRFSDVSPGGEQSGEHAVWVHSYEPQPAYPGDGIDRPGSKARASVASCVRRFCLDCVGATSGRAAFDCGSKVCPLRPASPFLGKSLPLTMRAEDYEGEPTRVAKRRPSRMIIHAQCRQCQPGDRTDCEATDCALYAYRPWDGPGKVDRRKASPAQLGAAARGRESMRQKASTAVGAAFDA
jgi:hypothetical protein